MLSPNVTATMTELTYEQLKDWVGADAPREVAAAALDTWRLRAGFTPEIRTAVLDRFTPATHGGTHHAINAFAISLEGECDPRRDPERGALLDGVLDNLTDGQLQAVRIACEQLESAACSAQMRNFGLQPQLLPSPPLLTVRQHEILVLTNEGLTAAEIAARLWIEPVTVRFHLHSLRKLFSVETTAELLTAAHACRYLPAVVHS